MSETKNCSKNPDVGGHATQALFKQCISSSEAIQQLISVAMQLHMLVKQVLGTL